MHNKIHVISVGFCKNDEENLNTMKANCSCTLIQTKSGLNILVDTMTAWDGELLRASLAKLNVDTADIHYVVCTHNHSDHTGCNYLFPHAKWHFVGTCRSHHEKYPVETEYPYALDGEDVQILSTPGHTLTCVSVVVKNVEMYGTVGICGDLFERSDDIQNSQVWLDAGSENPQAQRENRLKMAEMCSYIIPGHGEGFLVTKEIKQALQLDLKNNIK